MPRRVSVPVVNILQLSAGGHRLAYVAAIADAAIAGGLVVRLLTLPGVIASAEFAVHLAALQRSGSLETIERADLFSARGRDRVVSAIRRRGEMLVVPDSDRLLAELTILKLMRRLPSPSSFIVMRPPPFGRRTAKSLIVGASKVMLLSVLACFRRSVHLNLLEDPLATTEERVWRWPISLLGPRLDDPADLMGDTATLPPEMEHLSTDRGVIAVVGSIDKRKNLPLILAAWKLASPDLNATLVVAGRIASTVRAEVSAALASENVLVMDRYLSNEEILGVIDRAHALLVLYDGGFSSGLMTSAAAHGRWVICLHGSRTGAVAIANGFGVRCHDSSRALSDAMFQVATRTAFPPPVHLTASTDFGAKALALRGPDYPRRDCS